MALVAYLEPLHDLRDWQSERRVCRRAVMMKRNVSSEPEKSNEEDWDVHH